MSSYAGLAALAGAATFIVPRIRLRDASVGCTQIARIVRLIRELRRRVLGFDRELAGER
jgi:hypothetical protein